MGTILQRFEKKSWMTRVRACAVAVLAMFFVGLSNAWGGYVCNNPLYTRCDEGYFLSDYGGATKLSCTDGSASGSASLGNSAACSKCPTYCTCAGGKNCPKCVYEITLSSGSGVTSSGTTKIYQRLDGYYYKEFNFQTQITTNAAGITRPSRAGYVFDGYYTESGGAGTKVITASGYMANSNTPYKFSAAGTLYAKWRKCKAGYYCPGDNSENECGNGQWSAEGSSSCSSIDAGCYGKNGANSCPNKCEAGTYSKGGALSCTDCGDGKWSAEKSSSCSDIDAGCYGKNGANSCPNKCKVGTYSEGGAASCTDCPAGTYGDSEGLKSDSCSGQCTAGYYCPKKSTKDKVEDCGAKYYCPTGTKTRKSCGGDLTSGANATAKTDCYVKCSAGKYLEAGKDSCSTCVANSYCDGTATCNYNTSASCGINSCPAGSSGEGSDSRDDCKLTVTLDANGGSGTCKGGSISCSYNVSCSLPTWSSSDCKLTNGTNIFKNWSDSASGTSGVTSKTFTANTTIYALWKATTCSVEKGTGTAQNSTDNKPVCSVTCDTGYSSSGNKTGNAGETSVSYTCKANQFSITYAAGGATGSAPQSPKSCTYADSSCKAPQNTYIRTGYTFKGWKCTGGTTACNGDTVSAGADISKMSETANGITLTALWEANLYTVTLSKPSTASGGTDKLYVVYNTGIYFDKAHSMAVSSTIVAPNIESNGYTFEGYYDTGFGGVGQQFVNKNGVLVSDKFNKTAFLKDTTLYAYVKPKKVGCQAGYYLPAESITCVKCEAKNYCEAWGLDDKGEQSMEYDGMQHGNIKQCPRYATSAKGAKSLADCFVNQKTEFVENGKSYVIPGLKAYIYHKPTQ